jgi:hypothetical protein
MDLRLMLYPGKLGTIKYGEDFYNSSHSPGVNCAAMHKT